MDRPDVKEAAEHEKITVNWTAVTGRQPPLENYAFLVYVYYTHPSYQTSICGKNRVYYIQIFTVLINEGEDDVGHVVYVTDKQYWSKMLLRTGFTALLEQKIQGP